MSDLSPCPHADYPILICSYCVQMLLDPPEGIGKRKKKGPPQTKRPAGWKVLVGEKETIIWGGLNRAKEAARRMVGKRRLDKGLITFIPLDKQGRVISELSQVHRPREV